MENFQEPFQLRLTKDRKHRFGTMRLFLQAFDPFLVEGSNDITDGLFTASIGGRYLTRDLSFGARQQILSPTKAKGFFRSQGALEVSPFGFSQTTNIERRDHAFILSPPSLFHNLLSAFALIPNT